jgi:hypothetical protein
MEREGGHCAVLAPGANTRSYGSDGRVLQTGWMPICSSMSYLQQMIVVVRIYYPGHFYRGLRPAQPGTSDVRGSQYHSASLFSESNSCCVCQPQATAIWFTTEERQPNSPQANSVRETALYGNKIVCHFPWRLFKIVFVAQAGNFQSCLLSNPQFQRKQHGNSGVRSYCTKLSCFVRKTT